MRTALQATLALAGGVILLILAFTGDGRSTGAAARLSIDPAFGAVVALALLAFWMVMAWRAVRALESIAASLRRPAAPPAPPPATE